VSTAAISVSPAPEAVIIEEAASGDEPTGAPLSGPAHLVIIFPHFAQMNAELRKAGNQEQIESQIELSTEEPLSLRGALIKLTADYPMLSFLMSGDRPSSFIGGININHWGVELNDATLDRELGHFVFITIYFKFQSSSSPAQEGVGQSLRESINARIKYRNCSSGFCLSEIG